MILQPFASRTFTIHVYLLFVWRATYMSLMNGDKAERHVLLGRSIHTGTMAA